MLDRAESASRRRRGPLSPPPRWRPLRRPRSGAGRTPSASRHRSPTSPTAMRRARPGSAASPGEQPEGSGQRHGLVGAHHTAAAGAARAGGPYGRPGVRRPERGVGPGCHRHAAGQQRCTRVERRKVAFVYLLEIGIAALVDKPGIGDDGQSQGGQRDDEVARDHRAVFDAVAGHGAGGFHGGESEHQLNEGDAVHGDGNALSVRDSHQLDEIVEGGKSVIVEQHLVGAAGDERVGADLDVGRAHDVQPLAQNAVGHCSDKGRHPRGRGLRRGVGDADHPGGGKSAAHCGDLVDRIVVRQTIRQPVVHPEQPSGHCCPARRARRPARRWRQGAACRLRPNSAPTRFRIGAGRGTGAPGRRASSDHRSRAPATDS